MPSHVNLTFSFTSTFTCNWPGAYGGACLHWPYAAPSCCTASHTPVTQPTLLASRRPAFHMPQQLESVTNMLVSVTMKWSAAALGLAATAMAMPQAAPDNLKPDGGSPSGCSASYNGKFEVSIFKLGAAKRSIQVCNILIAMCTPVRLSAPFLLTPFTEA